MTSDTYSADPNIEPQITVNLKTRVIDVPEPLRDIGVNGDNNAETVFIKAPDSFDGVALNDKDIMIWFTNSKKELYSTKIALENIKHENDCLIIGWKIDERLTRYCGTTQFMVQFTVGSYTLNTLPADLNVLKGLNLFESAPPLENNFYEQLISRLSSLEIRILNLENKAIEIDDLNTVTKNQSNDIKQIQTELLWVKNNALFKVAVGEVVNG